MSISAGVPQGSVLGPLLFLVYINDLTVGVCSNIKLFADDASLFTRINNNVNASQERLMRDLEKITKWAYQWKMKFNPDITKQAIEVVFSCKYAKTKPIHPLLPSTAYRLPGSPLQNTLASSLMTVFPSLNMSRRLSPKPKGYCPYEVPLEQGLS